MEVSIQDLLPKNGLAHESEEEYQRIDSADATNQLIINNLSEALNRSSKSIENLICIIAEKYIDKKD